MATLKKREGHWQIVTTDGLKICTKCKEFKELEEFHKNHTRSSGRESQCKVCIQRPSSRKRKLTQRYNITEVEYDSLLLKQENKCKICHIYLNRPHLDHDHTSKRIRGILCQSCNIGLGCFKDNLQSLRDAIKYLESVVE